eukprot:GHVU01127654.1.p1 GENE.GHVU01127654.1~~GHVU01127654.1.p1  ORF type:complete len:194 (+),score=14.03 GHVU01127654.1:80-661(+)
MLPSRSQAKVLLQRKSLRGIRSWEPTLLNDALDENKFPDIRVEDRRVVTFTSAKGTSMLIIKDIDAAGLVEAYLINNYNEQRRPLYEVIDTRNRTAESQGYNTHWFNVDDEVPGVRVEEIIREELRYLNMSDDDLLLSITPGRAQDSTTRVRLLKELSLEKDTRIFTIVVVDSKVRLLHLIGAIGRLHGPLTD